MLFGLMDIPKNKMTKSYYNEKINKKLKRNNKSNYSESQYTASFYENKLKKEGFIQGENYIFEGKDGHSLRITFFESPENKNRIAVFSDEAWFEPMKDGKRIGNKNNGYYGREFGALIYAMETDEKNPENLYSLAKSKQKLFEEEQRTLYKSWNDLSFKEKEKIVFRMKKSNHIKNDSEAEEEYDNHKTFWGILK